MKTVSFAISIKYNRNHESNRKTVRNDERNCWVVSPSTGHHIVYHRLIKSMSMTIPTFGVTGL